MKAITEVCDRLALWAQLAADVSMACLADGPAGAGEASRIRRASFGRRQRRFA